VSRHRNRVVVCSTDDLFSRALGHALHDFEVEIVDQERLQNLEGEALVWKINGAVPSNTSDVAARLPTLMLGEEQQLLTAVDAGCRGFLESDASIEEIRSAVLAISAGGAVIPPSMLGSLLRHLVQRRRGADNLRESLAALTSRELEVYRLAARGLGREQIATALFISPDTVRTHLQKIYGKLGVHSRAELAALSAPDPSDDLEGPGP
jgi:DNA-binding NarL/FixJ family response regulator